MYSSKTNVTVDKNTWNLLRIGIKTAEYHHLRAV